MLELNIGDIVTIVCKSYGTITTLKPGEIKSISPKKGDITVEFKNGSITKFNSLGNDLNRGKFCTNSSEILDENDEKQLTAVAKFRNEIKLEKLKKLINEKMQTASVEQLEKFIELLSE